MRSCVSALRSFLSFSAFTRIVPGHILYLLEDIDVSYMFVLSVHMWITPFFCILPPNLNKDFNMAINQASALNWLSRDACNSRSVAGVWAYYNHPCVQ